MNTDLNKLMQSWTKDQARTGAMSLALAVGLLLWGRLLLMPNVTKTAVARPRQDATAMNRARANTLASASSALALPATLKRDLFALDPQYYQHLEMPVEKVATEQKSVPQISEQEQKDAQVRLALKKLKLESTVRGNVPLAVINGESVTPGATISGFEVIEVLPRSVRLRMLDREVELEF